MGKKRKFEMGRVPTMTRIGAKRVIHVRGRGGNIKTRALKTDYGNFSWGSEAISCKTRVMATVNNAIVFVDSAPFRQWYLKKYDVELNKKKLEESNKLRADTKRSGHAKAKTAAKGKDRKIEPKLAD